MDLICRCAAKFCCAALTSVASVSQAGTITSAGTPSGPGLDWSRVSSHVDTVQPDDADANAPYESLNFFDYELHLAGISAAGIVDLPFAVSASGGVTQYDFWADIRNKGPQAWAGLQLTLGTGTGDNFVPLTASSGFTFDDTSLYWPVENFVLTAPSPTQIQWAGTVSSEPVDFYYTVLVPNGLSSLTVRHTPIPEPASMALLGIAATAIVARLRGRPRRPH
jgi:hypothetical protein